MTPPHHITASCSIILILLLQASLYAKTTPICPIGFQLTYSIHDKISFCYRLKGPEKFTDTFENCTGNLYTDKLLNNLIMDRTNLVLWTEYRSAYPGGPFVDVSYAKSTGSLLKSSFNVTNTQLGIEEDLCVAKLTNGDYTAERCDKEYYRYCVIRPYLEDYVSHEGCEDLKGGIRFYSPKQMCLTAVTGVHDTGVRATWPQANKLCEKKGGEMLYNGWRYSNNPRLHVSTSHTGIYPLHVTYDPRENITFSSTDGVILRKNDGMRNDSSTPMTITDKYSHRTEKHLKIHDDIDEYMKELIDPEYKAGEWARSIKFTAPDEKRATTEYEYDAKAKDVFRFNISRAETPKIDELLTGSKSKSSNYSKMIEDHKVPTVPIVPETTLSTMKLPSSKRIMMVDPTFPTTPPTPKTTATINRTEPTSTTLLFTEITIPTTRPMELMSSHTDLPDAPNETLYGVLRNGTWKTVNSSYPFHDVICEKKVEMANITLSVKSDSDNKLILESNRAINVENILCYTDSKTFYPSPVNIGYDDSELLYILSPENDGNYWCIYNDIKKFQVSQSNKYLWIREKESLKNRYAVKIFIPKKYTLEKIGEVIKYTEKKLRSYIYYSTMFRNSTISDIDDIEDSKEFEESLKRFKDDNPELNSKVEKILCKIKLKELYLDAKSFLVHVELDPTMKPAPPGWWSNIKVIFMKPVHFCSVDGHLFDLKYTKDCLIYSCVGNFNKGMVPVITRDEFCSMAARAALDTEVTDSMPVADVLPGLKNNTGSKNSGSNSSEETIEDTMPTVPEPEPTLIITPPPSDTIITAEPSFPTTTMTPETTETTGTTETTTTTTVEVTTVPTIPTPRPPNEQLHQVMEDLEQLLQNDTLPVTDISEPFDRVDELLEQDVALEIPSRLLQLLDRIGSSLYLNGSDTAREVRNNVALVAANADPNLPVNGFRIASRENDVFTNDAFEIIRDDLDSGLLSSDKSEAIVRLPSSVATSSRRVSFVVFRNDRAFHTDIYNKSVNSRILSINVENTYEFTGGEVINIYFRPLSGPLRNQSRTCAYWKFDENDGTGSWSQDGCIFIEATQPGMMDSCQCNHLTHFAEILISKTVFSELDEKILEILSVIGCCLSIFGLTMVGITAILFRSWRRDFNNKIWLHLCLSILLLVVCFLISVFIQFRRANLGCMFLGILLHFSVLASFCWMLVAAVLSYRRLVMVFTRDATHKLLRASAFAWGVPIAVVGILLASAPDSYKQQFEDITPTGSFCYPSGLALWLAVYAPIALMLLINWTLFILILRSVFGSRGIERHGDSNEAIRCATVSCLLVFLFGLPWIFGLFAYNVVAAYFFAITATFQGFVLFVFFIIGNKKTRDLWLNKLKIKQTLRVPVTTSTYTNRSTGGPVPGWRGVVTGTVEAKVSKPKSLANNDNSRFS